MRHALALIALSCLWLRTLQAESALPLAERFALADEREVVVAGLVPGTDEHFYYRALLWQHQSKLAEVDALMPRWKELHPRSTQRSRIELRQAALWFDRDQAIGARRLAEAAGLEFTVPDDGPITAVAHSRFLVTQGGSFPPRTHRDQTGKAESIKRNGGTVDDHGWVGLCPARFSDLAALGSLPFLRFSCSI